MGTARRPADMCVLGRRLSALAQISAPEALLYPRGCAMRARFRRSDADRLAAGPGALLLGGEVALIVAGVGIVRSLVLAIGVGIEERAIAGLRDHLLRHRGRADDGQNSRRCQ